MCACSVVFAVAGKRLLLVVTIMAAEIIVNAFSGGLTGAVSQNVLYSTQPVSN